MTIMAGRGYSKGNVPSAERNEYQDVPPVIHGDGLGGSIDKDTHYDHTRRMEARKYLRKSYCHRIECCLGLPNSQRARESVRWDKHSSSDLDDQQM